MIFKALAIVFFTLLPLSALAAPSLIPSNLSSGRFVFSYTLLKKTTIHSIDMSSGEISELAPSKTKALSPQWSPDGTRVSFQAISEDNSHIYIVNDDGSKLQKISKPGMQPSWDRTGNVIYFASPDKNGVIQIYQLDLLSKKHKQLSKSKHNLINPVLSPRKDYLAVISSAHWPGADLGLLNLSKKSFHLLSTSRHPMSSPTWSPDSSGVSFAVELGGESDIWHLAKGDVEAKRLTSLPGREYDACWSRDMRRLFFVAEPNPGSGLFQIYMQDMKTSEVSQLTTGPGSIRHISFTDLPKLTR